MGFVSSFFLVNLPIIKFCGFPCRFPFLCNEDWKEKYCIVARVINPFWKFFFFCILFGFVALLAEDLDQQDNAFIHVEMRVLKTLRKMVNIKVFL